MKIKTTIFTALLSIGGLTSASRYEFRPLAAEITVGAPAYNPADMQDWQEARDSLSTKYRLLQCAGIRNAQSPIEHKDLAAVHLRMLNRSHLCDQFSQGDLDAITKESWGNHYSQRIEALQVKCAAKT